MSAESCENGRGCRIRGHLAAILLVVAAIVAAAGIFYFFFQHMEKTHVISFRHKRRLYRSADLDAEEAAQQDTTEPDEA